MASTSPDQPGGTSSVDSGSSTTAGPAISVPGGRDPAQHLELDALAAEHGLAPAALQLAPAAVAAGELDVDPGAVAVTRIVTSSSSCSASR